MTDTRYRFLYSMRRGLAHLTSITVTSHSGEELWDTAQAEENGEVLLFPSEAGEYSICFNINKRAKALTSELTIDMELGLESHYLKMYESFQGESKLTDPTLIQAEYLERMLTTADNTLTYFKKRGLEQYYRNEGIKSKAISCTVASIIVVVLCTGLSFWKLSTFLVKKKFVD